MMKGLDHRFDCCIQIRSQERCVLSTLQRWSSSNIRHGAKAATRERPSKAHNQPGQRRPRPTGSKLDRQSGRPLPFSRIRSLLFAASTRSLRLACRLSDLANRALPRPAAERLSEKREFARCRLFVGTSSLSFWCVAEAMQVVVRDGTAARRCCFPLDLLTTPRLRAFFERPTLLHR